MWIDMSGGLNDLVPYWSYGVMFMEMIYDGVGYLFITVRDGIKYQPFIAMKHGIKYLHSTELWSTLRMAAILIVTGVIAIKALRKVYVD
jgi:hypothetical protein